ncbi:hypothetical protein HU200_027923 [Digitaria exilis]|uniref:Uncharacterized protein n=1 Tax=Digitaria exilis TaxID=1010633 RepID=A0A835ET05_9POAL|nr:hypothetical protein HU200_027923 [Digitaria exilis]
MGSQRVRVGIHGWDPRRTLWKRTRPWRASSTIEPSRRSAGTWHRKEDVETKPSFLTKAPVLTTAPSMGSSRWKLRKRARKRRAETRRLQRLQTRAARRRLAGSSGGKRMRTSSTSSSSSCGGGAMLLGWLESPGGGGGGGGARVWSERADWVGIRCVLPLLLFLLG